MGGAAGRVAQSRLKPDVAPHAASFDCWSKPRRIRHSALPTMASSFEWGAQPGSVAIPLIPGLLSAARRTSRLESVCRHTRCIRTRRRHECRKRCLDRFRGDDHARCPHWPHGAVIGSRALVTKNVEPYMVIGGNPAKPIRKRFSDGEIEMLLEMNWWDWPFEESSQSIGPLVDAIKTRAIERGSGGTF